MNKLVIYKLVASDDEPPQVIPIMYVDDADQAQEFYKNQVYKHLKAVGWYTDSNATDRATEAFWEHFGTDKGETHPDYDGWCEDWCKALDHIEEQHQFQEDNDWLGVSIQMMAVPNWRQFKF